MDATNVAIVTLRCSVYYYSRSPKGKSLEIYCDE